MAQLFIGLMAEGATDYRFLRPVIENTLLTIAYNEVELDLEIQVFDIIIDKVGRFNDNVLSASKIGFKQFGIMTLVIHTDADSLNCKKAYNNKVYPAIELIRIQSSTELCKEIIALIPIYETESWMLADKELFKKYIGTKKTNAQLGIDGHPETFSQPKEKIKEAIRIGRMDLPNKIKKNITIEDLYSILGEAISLESLCKFESYRDFEKNVRNALINLNLIIKK